MDAIDFEERLAACRPCHPLVPFIPGIHRLLQLDFTAGNLQLTTAVLEDTALFTQVVAQAIAAAGCQYGIGGYAEHRTVYSRSPLFNGTQPGEEPRRLHLGVDIWGPAGTPVYAPLQGQVHSFANHAATGDYGPTLVLQHALQGVVFYTLYGHLSTADLDQWQQGRTVPAGELIGHMGIAAENGQWPPHVHFQLIRDLQGCKGDYNGVCAFSERQWYLANCPNPDVLLDMMRLAEH